MVEFKIGDEVIYKNNTGGVSGLDGTEGIVHRLGLGNSVLSFRITKLSPNDTFYRLGDIFTVGLTQNIEHRNQPKPYDPEQEPYEENDI